MAEIKIEKKKPVWPWIVALLLVAAVIYFIFFRDNEVKNDGSVEMENSTSENTRSQNKNETGLNQNNTLAAYGSFINNKNLYTA